MTKRIRIEDADTSAHNVIVQTWMRGRDGEPDSMVKEETLPGPCSLLEGWIWHEQYIVIKEAASK